MSEIIHVQRVIDSPCIDPNTGKEIPKDSVMRVMRSIHVMSYINKGYLKIMPDPNRQKTTNANKGSK